MDNKTSALNFRGLSISSVVYVIGDVLTRGATFLLIPLYTRFLTPSEYGNWGVLLSLISFLNILFSLQLGSALTVSYFHYENDQRKQLISTIWILIFIVSMGMSTLLLIVGRGWASKIFQGINSFNFILTVGITFFATFAIVPQTLLKLRQRAFVLVSVNFFLYLLGTVLGIVLLICYKIGETGLLLGMFCANLLSVIPYIIILRGDLNLNFSKTLAQSSFLIALPVLPHMLSHWGLNLMDRIILQAYVPLSDVGIYQLGYQLGASFQIIVIAFNNAWTPFFLEGFKQSEKWEGMASFSSWLIFVQVWIALFIAIFLPLIVQNVFSKEYFSAVHIIPWVVLGFVFVLFYQYWVNVLLFYKKTASIPIATGISALVNLILNLIFVPRFGYLVAAINTAIGYAILASITFLLASKLTSFSFEYIRWIKVSFIGAAIYFLASMIKLQPMFLLILVRSIILFSFPLLLYFVSFWRRSELESLFAWLKKRKSL